MYIYYREKSLVWWGGGVGSLGEILLHCENLLQIVIPLNQLHKHITRKMACMKYDYQRPS